MFVFRQYYDQPATEAEIGTTISAYLKYAPDSHGGGGRKKDDIV